MAAPMALKPLSLHVISDSICPFCYMGYKQLNLAMAAAKKENLPLDFKLRFKPFLLDPTLPTDKPLNKREHYDSKFGAANFARMEKQMAARGKTVGINFSYGGNIRQTIDSHRLIEKAFLVGGDEKQRLIIDALFGGYFEKEQDVGDHDFLAECAVQAGVFASKPDAVAFLATDELRDGVQKDITDAKRMGVEGVPFILLNNKYAVSGAQGEETFLQIFRKIAAGEKLAADESSEDTC
ncbi:DSBA domain-containing protein [Mycena indigotica]|uniref:DSBA domain-containing protein n=1 Tax=Mycena indigotica TaxID=2126181 RepID=A0A8H6S6B7_9AGAR|nr:DSBA domain-containing protein [Mycena indigotica]KAF7293025.1 DSBA domain-containing protein [Mycena indigotica]